MATRRVVVTGVGAISALGHDAPSLWAAHCAGRSGIGPLAEAKTLGLRYAAAARVRDWTPETHFTQGQLLLLDRFAQFAVVAAREALGAAGLARAEIGGPQTALVVGSGSGGEGTRETASQALFRDGHTRVHPFLVPRSMPSAAASQVSMDLGITGPVLTVSTACATGTHAIGLASWLVRAGLVERAIAGASEAPFTIGVLRAWDALRVVSPDTCRPFACDRRGMILGEGAGMLVLETLEGARARGAAPLAEIVGFGMSADAHHITQPSLDGPLAAMRAALADAGLPPEAVGHVNAHGTGTPTNDATEARALHALLGAAAPRVAVTATKSLTGHPIGAAGALEAVATTLALAHGVVPPTANVDALDPSCALDVVVEAPRPLDAEYALSNSFAFGGLNAVLAFRRLAPAAHPPAARA